MRSNIRLAIVSTPRAGNTWVNYCISEIAKLSSVGVHRYTDIENKKLPSRILIQIHAAFDDEGFQRFVSQNNFQVITVVRHPLDILISMLRFMQVQASPLQWLDGTVNIAELYGISPADQKFIDWCLGKGASKLLHISYDWAKSGQACAIRYEDLLANPIEQIQKVLARLKIRATNKSIAAALAKFDPQYFRDRANQHSWKASKDNWKDFFTKDDAEKIYSKYHTIFDYFGYTIEGPLHNQRETNLRKWTENINKGADIYEHFYAALKESEVQAKRTLLDKIQNEKDLELVRRQVTNKVEALDTIHRELESLRQELNAIVPLRKHLQRSLRRIANAEIKIGRKQTGEDTGLEPDS